MTYGNFVYFSKFGYNALILKMTIFFSGKLEKGEKLAKNESIFSTLTAKFHSEHNGAFMFTIGYL